MKKRRWCLKVLIIMILCGLAGTAVTAFLYTRTPDPSTAQTKIEFTFNGAADAVAPNGQSFSIDELSSDTILAAALKNAGMDGRYTADQVRTSLKVSGQYPDDLLEKAENFTSLINYDAKQTSMFQSFQPTLFNVELTNQFDPTLSEGDQTALLESIMSTYTDYFRQHYGTSLDLDLYTRTFTLADYDYIQQLEILEQQITTVSDYCNELYRRAPLFKLNGTTFNDIAVRLQNLSSSSIAQLSANLFLNALAKDPQRLLNQYQYMLRKLVYQLETRQAYLANLNTLLASYERNGVVYLSAGNAFMTIDGNSSKTYTTLNQLKDSVTSDISRLSAQIAEYQSRMNDLSKDAAAPSAPQADAVPAAGTDADGDAETAEAPSAKELTETIEAAEAVTGRQMALLQQQIDAILTETNQILSDFQTLLTAYTDQQINAGTVTVSSVRYRAPSLFSIAFLVKAIKFCAPLCVVAFILSILAILPGLRKHYSWENIEKEEAEKV